MKRKYLIILLVMMMYSINHLIGGNGIPLDTVPNNAVFNSLMLQGDTYQQQGKRQQALDTYKKAINANPSSGQPYIKIGMLYWKANENCPLFKKKLIAIESIRNFQIAEKMKDTQAIAKAKIKEFQKYLPSREYSFQRALKKGQKILAGCTLKVIVTIP